MIDKGQWPESSEAASALVALVLAEILAADREARDALLADFTRTAWPSPRAARQ